MTEGADKLAEWSQDADLGIIAIFLVVLASILASGSVSQFLTTVAGIMYIKYVKASATGRDESIQEILLYLMVPAGIVYVFTGMFSIHTANTLASQISGLILGVSIIVESGIHERYLNP